MICDDFGGCLLVIIAQLRYEQCRSAQALPSRLDAAPRISGVLHLLFFSLFFGVSLSKTSAPWVIVLHDVVYQCIVYLSHVNSVLLINFTVIHSFPAYYRHCRVVPESESMGDSQPVLASVNPCQACCWCAAWVCSVSDSSKSHAHY